MQMKTDGLIIRDLNVGEADRIVTILSRDHGVIQASAKGARRVKSRISTSTRLFCYSDFTFYKGRDMYIIDDAQSKEFFLGLDRDLEGLALAQYLAQLSMFIAPKEENAESYLRLMLNSLSFIKSGKKPVGVIKPAFEMRALSLSGYMPDLVACQGCGAYEADLMFLDPVNGTLTCSDCETLKGAEQPTSQYNKKCRLSKGALAALRHIVFSEFEKVFSFTLPEEPLHELDEASERYLLCCLDRSFPTLDFYHSITTKL